MSTTQPRIDQPAEQLPAESRSQRSGRTKRRVAVGGTAIVVVVLAILVARSLFSAVTPHLYSGTVLQQSTPAPDMNGLSFVDGEPVDVGAMSGDLVLVYFGYTNCPDVCPTTLSSAATAIEQLNSDQQQRVRLMMVTVDPERDRPRELEEYVEFFHPEFDGISGAPADIGRVASLYGIFYELGEGSIEEGYVVDHTATLMAIGTDGTLRIVWPPSVTTSDLRDDLKELL